MIKEKEVLFVIPVAANPNSISSSFFLRKDVGIHPTSLVDFLEQRDQPIKGKIFQHIVYRQ